MIAVIVSVVTGMFFVGSILTANTFLPGFFAITSGLLILMVFGMFRIFYSPRTRQRIRSEHTDPLIEKRLKKMNEVIPMDDLVWREKAFRRLFIYAALAAMVFFSAMGQIRIPGIAYSLPLSLLTPTVSIQGPWLVIFLTALLSLGVFALIQIVRNRINRKPSDQEKREAKPGFWRRAILNMAMFGLIVLSVLPLAKKADSHMGSPRSLKWPSLQTAFDNLINRTAPIDRQRVSSWFTPREDRTTETGVKQAQGGRRTRADTARIGPVNQIDYLLNGLCSHTQNDEIIRPPNAIQNREYKNLETPVTFKRITTKGLVQPLFYDKDAKQLLYSPVYVTRDLNNFYLEAKSGQPRAQVNFLMSPDELNRTRYLRYDYNGIYKGQKSWLDVKITVLTNNRQEQEIYVRPWFTYGYVSLDLKGAILREGLDITDITVAEVSIRINHSQGEVFGNLQNLRLASEHTEFWKRVQTIDIYDYQQVKAFYMFQPPGPHKYKWICRTGL